MFVKKIIVGFFGGALQFANKDSAKRPRTCFCTGTIWDNGTFGLGYHCREAAQGAWHSKSYRSLSVGL